MKIADLKQPYRRMAEYLAKKNTNEAFTNKDVLIDAFYWYSTKSVFWIDIYCGGHPPITEEIKQYFPPDFDFSGEVEDERRYNFAFKNKMEEKYTQLAKEGKFDELPDTCEFSEGVELEVMICNDEFKLAKVHGKFKGRFMCVMEDNTGYLIYKEVRLPSTTPKIDFSEFKAGDVVEVEYYVDEGYDNIVGYIYELNDYSINISIRMSYLGDYEIISKQNIKSITKIK